MVAMQLQYCVETPPIDAFRWGTPEKRYVIYFTPVLQHDLVLVSDVLRICLELKMFVF